MHYPLGEDHIVLVEGLEQAGDWWIECTAGLEVLLTGVLVHLGQS